MLSFEENSWNFKALQILSRLNLLPIEIDIETGEIKEQSKRWKRYLWIMLYLLTVLYSIYLHARLIQTLLNPNLFTWGHFVFHFLYVVAFSWFDVVGYILFLANSLEFTLISSSVTMKTLPTAQLGDVENEMVEDGEIDAGQQVENGIVEDDPSPQNRKGEDQVSNEALEKTPQDARPICLIRPVWTLSPQYNLQELLARFLQFPWTAGGIGSLCIVAIDPTRPQLLFFSLSQEFQNVFTFAVLYVFEIAFVAEGFAVAYICFFIQLQFLEKCQAEFQRMSDRLKDLADWVRLRTQAGTNIRDMDTKCEVIRGVIRDMRQLVALTNLFNQVYPFCIFATKLLCMINAILGFFCFIRLTGSHPGVGGFMAYSAVLLSSIYIILHEKAFAIPENMEQLKKEVLVTAHNLFAFKDSAALFRNLRARVCPLTWGEVKKEMKSFRNVGIRVGSFHLMERESTPNFLDFVFSQVVDLLVSFPA